MKLNSVTIGGVVMKRGKNSIADYLMSIAENMGGGVTFRDAVAEAFASAPLNFSKQRATVVRRVLMTWDAYHGRPGYGVNRLNKSKRR